MTRDTITSTDREYGNPLYFSVSGKNKNNLKYSQILFENVSFLFNPYLRFTNQSKKILFPSKEYQKDLNEMEIKTYSLSFIALLCEQCNECVIQKQIHIFVIVFFSSFINSTFK